MKKIYLTVLLLFSTFISVRSQWLFTQYFDGADTAYESSLNISIDTAAGNIWQIGIPQKVIFDSAATVPNAIVTDTINNYPVNNTSTFTISVLNQFASWGVLAFQWMQK